MSTIQNLHVAYGFTQPLLNQISPPILAPRSPLATDKAQLGTIWINKILNVAFVLTSIDNNQANWQALAGAVSLPSLTVNPGPVSITGAVTIEGVTAINATGVDSTVIGFGGTGSVTIGNNIGGVNFQGEVAVFEGMSVGDGLQVEDGFTANGPMDLNVGEADATSIGTGGTGSVSIGNVTGQTTFTGQVNITTGDLQFNTAGTGITLPGPVTIRSGAGAPAGGLAVNVGDMYINTTAATAATRVYVATAAGVWTNLTAAA